MYNLTIILIIGGGIILLAGIVVSYLIINHLFPTLKGNSPTLSPQDVRICSYLIQRNNGYKSVCSKSISEGRCPYYPCSKFNQVVEEIKRRQNQNIQNP